MASDLNGILNHADLRLRAVRQLAGANNPHDARLSPSAAFRVLHDLASSPSTAAAAMALLHELQVHQVEVDLQEEEMRRSRAELEATLQRQLQLYDFAPVGQLTVDESTRVRELNLTGARLLGSERDELLGLPLESFLMPQSAGALRAMLAQFEEGARSRGITLHLSPAQGAPRTVHASVGLDPDGVHFLIGFVEAGGAEG